MTAGKASRSSETALSITMCCRFGFNNRYADETHENTRRRRRRRWKDNEARELYKGIKPERSTAKTRLKHVWIARAPLSEKNGKESSIYFRCWDVPADQRRGCDRYYRYVASFVLVVTAWRDWNARTENARLITSICAF